MTLYFGAMMKVVITGPESSGKTTLAEALAVHYRTSLVPEAARGYLETRAARTGTTRYAEEDLLHIARLQTRTEDARAEHVARAGGHLLFCDTDLITIRIWGDEKFGRSDPWIRQQTASRPYGLWLLCAPDMPWMPDPLRENPHDRDRLFNVYERTLRELAKPYAIMRGPLHQRLASAIADIDRLRDAHAFR